MDIRPTAWNACCNIAYCLTLIVPILLSAPPARADSPTSPPPVNDPTGADQTTPTSLSVPNYTKLDPAHATIKDLAIQQDNIAQRVSANYFSINFVWTLLAGFLVMFMQAGFALVETGLCRAKNAAHLMCVNFLVYALGMTGFFICGYALMCGGVNGTSIGGPGMLGGMPTLNSMAKIGQWGIFGKTGFFLAGGAYDAQAIVWFLFMMVFMDTTATIPTGALAERWGFKSFFFFTLLVGAFIYPVYGCWVWGGGWLAQLGKLAGLGHGAVDFAGSGVVHLQGGSLALIGALLLGPRIGKYDSSGKPRPIPGHNIPYVVLGTFILAFGWFGFNAGSSLAGTDGRIGIVATNTMLASASGALFLSVHVAGCGQTRPDHDVQRHARRSGCDHRAVRVRGAVGGVCDRLDRGGAGHLECLFHRAHRHRRSGGRDQRTRRQRRLGVDLAGTLRRRNLRRELECGRWNRRRAVLQRIGRARQLLAQMIDVGVCVTWNVLAGGVLLYVVGKLVGGNRVSPEEETTGMDIAFHGERAYYMDLT